MGDIIKERKNDHIEVCLKENVQSRKISTGFEDVHLIHRALPNIEREKIDTSLTFFGHKFCAPIFIGAMTGGTPMATKINSAIAKAIEELNLGMGVGSQRIAIENSKVEHSFSVIRENAPTAFILANIGGPQLVNKYGIKQAKKAVEMVQANALVIHLNALQEVVQTEGETNFSNLIKKIEELTQGLDIPIIVKETGAGISSDDAKLLEDAGVAGIDIAGAGGTSWAAVEFYRAKARNDSYSQRLGETFWDWGIPTVVSLLETVNSINLPVIASGGVRTGIDVIKSLVLGASLASATFPFLEPAMNGSEYVRKALEYLIGEIRTTMFLIGVKSIPDLQNIPFVLTGKTSEWLKMRGFQPDTYARRK